MKDKTACIAGLGYVGLPLALACLHDTCRRSASTWTRARSGSNDNPNTAFTDDPEDIGNADFIIIAVPGPCHQIERLGPLPHLISNHDGCAVSNV